MENKECRCIKKFEDAELKALLDEDPCQTETDLSNNVFPNVYMQSEWFKSKKIESYVNWVDDWITSLAEK